MWLGLLRQGQAVTAGSGGSTLCQVFAQLCCYLHDSTALHEMTLMCQPVQAMLSCSTYLALSPYSVDAN